MKVSGVYFIRNLVNNKVYIGSSVDVKARWNVHYSLLKRDIHWNKHLQSAWNKCRGDNFVFNIFEEVEDVNKLYEREQYWLDKIQSYERCNGYNMAEDAEASMRGRKIGPMSKEHREKLSKAHKGVKRGSMSEEQKRKISKGERGKKLRDTHKVGCQCPFCKQMRHESHDVSLKTRKKISIGLKKYYKKLKLKNI